MWVLFFLKDFLGGRQRLGLRLQFRYGLGSGLDEVKTITKT